MELLDVEKNDEEQALAETISIADDEDNDEPAGTEATIETAAGDATETEITGRTAGGKGKTTKKRE